MTKESTDYCFKQLHIDVARNATDDFNLFHDPHKWHYIKNNPFGGTIVLGFQLESLVEKQVIHFRHQQDELKIIEQHKLHFSNYQFTFANPVKPNEIVNIDIKKSQFKITEDNAILSNRISVKTNGKLALVGFKKESSYPLFLDHADFSNLGHLQDLEDRCYILNTDFFLKRKFMNTSNAKNFLCSSFTDQSLYFDELNNKMNFPEIFPCSLASSALLEKALLNHHDFENHPTVYTTHKITLDRTQLKRVKSNTILHILIRGIPDKLGSYECYGLIDHNKILFREIISLTLLQNILK